MNSMKKAEKIAYLALAVLGALSAVAVGFWKHNITFWAALLFFAVALLYALDRPVFMFRQLSYRFPLFPTREDAIAVLEDNMLYGEPEKRYARTVRAVCLFSLAFGWGIVLYGALYGKPL